MKRCQQPLLLLWVTAVAALSALGCAAAEDGVKNLTGKPLQVIPQNDSDSTVTKLLMDGGLIALNETDRQALATYPGLVELHLDGNLVSSIPAKYFSVVPQLRVLSLSGNKISSLDPEAFSGLDVLTELDLSRNLLTSLHTQLWTRLKRLQVLKLQENPWNCSCPLLNSTTGPAVTCASLEDPDGRDLLRAAGVCDTSTPPASTTDAPQEPQTTVASQRSTVLKTTPTSQNVNNTNKGQTPVLGNTWKFTACVSALALGTFMLIACGIKGPSWYKLFHDYRHRRLNDEEDEEDEEDVVSTVFSETGRYRTHQTFTFDRENEWTEDGEGEGYFEDPYIKREELHTVEEGSAEPRSSC